LPRALQWEKEMGSPTALDGTLTAMKTVDRLTNSYALVTYIPGRLGDFLSQLRNELVPGCNLHSHVTFLPPRHLKSDRSTAWNTISAVCERWSPFSIELTDVELFPGTNVAYLALGDGRMLVEEFHRQLNQGPLHFTEPFAFHPHITLAQGVPECDVCDVRELAVRRWGEFQGERSFLVDEIAFVHNVAGTEWVDLNALALSTHAAVAR
jgi:2'-5' RNA ligase